MADVEAPRARTARPVLLMPGPLGLDSPAVPPRGTLLPRYRWYAWIDLIADRTVGRPSPRHVIGDALGRPVHERWGLWWLTTQPGTGRQLLHRARVVIVDGGGDTLLSACMLSLPWQGPAVNVVPRQQATRIPETLPRCTSCAAADPDDPATAEITVPPRKGSDDPTPTAPVRRRSSDRPGPVPPERLRRRLPV